MSKVVELVGPSGVGKTAIYKYLLKSWRPNPYWVLYDNFSRPYNNWLKYAADLLFEKIGIRILRERKYKADVSPEWKFIEMSDSPFFNEKKGHFKTTLMNLIQKHCASGFSGQDNRFVAVYMFMWCMAYVDAVQSNRKDDRYCLLRNGEGYITRVMHLNSPNFDDTSLNAYLDIIPFPDVVFFLDLDADDVLKRIGKKGNRSSLHYGMDNDQILTFTQSTISLFKKAVEKAENSGTKVYKIDASQDIGKSAQIIVERLADEYKINT